MEHDFHAQDNLIKLKLKQWIL